MSKIGLIVGPVLSGIAASALGTLAMDASLYSRYRHGAAPPIFLPGSSPKD